MKPPKFRICTDSAVTGCRSFVDDDRGPGKIAADLDRPVPLHLGALDDLEFRVVSVDGHRCRAGERVCGRGVQAPRTATASAAAAAAIRFRTGPPPSWLAKVLGLQ